MPTMKYMPRKQIDNRQVRRQVDSKSPIRFLVIFFVALVIAAGMIFFGWIRWKQREVVYRINKVEAEVTVAWEEKKKLLAELESLRAPARISRIAREKLGMVQPEADDYIIVEIEERDNGGAE